MCFTVLISKVYLIRVLSFIGGLRFNVRGEHVQGCIGRGVGKGLCGYQPGVYVPLFSFLLFKQVTNTKQY